MFSTVIQSPVLSLFSSTGSDPLGLFSTHIDTSLPSDSCIHLLHDQKSLPLPPAPASIIASPSLTDTDDDLNESGYSLDQTVLQIQSPTQRTTYIQSPPIGQFSPGGRSLSGAQTSDLGIKHPWMHVQVRNMGREWSFEVGLVDQSGRMGIIRLSTFQKQPRLRLSTKPSSSPLLHLPLSFPLPSSRPLTAWSTVALHLPSFLPYFSSPNLIAPPDENLDEEYWSKSIHTHTIGIVPTGTYSHVAYIRVYATCRLRRIWFAKGGPSQKVPWEFELYGSE